jgi:DUF3037 family protein
MTIQQPYTYTILRYVHDVTTGEFVNVGVVMHLPREGRLLAKVLTTTGQMRRVFPDLDRAAFTFAMRTAQRGRPTTRAKRYLPTIVRFNGLCWALASRMMLRRRWLVSMSGSFRATIPPQRTEEPTMMFGVRSWNGWRSGTCCLACKRRPRYAHEYARLAGLTKHRNVRDQLIDLARGWTAVAQHERRSDVRVLRFTPATTSPETQQRSRRQSRP